MLNIAEIQLFVILFVNCWRNTRHAVSDKDKRKHFWHSFSQQVCPAGIHLISRVQKDLIDFVSFEALH